MISFFEWYEQRAFRPDEPWLILGKGPSYARREQHDLAPFRTVALNHVVRDGPVTLAHAIDLDVVGACADALRTNCEALVMPWVPHVENAPGARTLDEVAREHPVLADLAGKGKLVWYNLRTGEGRNRPGSPVIRCIFFSAEAALNLLAAAGARRVRSLGVDGGASYSAKFQDLSGKTLLGNQRKSFDRQFAEIARTILATGVDFAPLDVASPIQVFVATTDGQMLATKVLEYSIRKHASLTTKVHPLHRVGIDIPMPRDEKNRPRTPFSFQRFLIPQACGFKGRAVYLDSDMQVFKDMRALWTMDMGGADLLAAGAAADTARRPQFSVMLLDCEALRWDVRDIVRRLDEGELDYAKLMYEMRVARDVRADIDPCWNSLESYTEGETALLHYTDMHTQPWVSRENPSGYLWVRDLIEAVGVGFIPLDFLKDDVAKGFSRPSLLWQVEHGVEDPLLLPRAARALDRAYEPPFDGLKSHGRPSRLVATRRFLSLAVRRLYRRTPLERLRRRIRTYRTDLD